MNNTARLVLALVGAAALAALAVPEISSYLPPGVGAALAASIAAVLHKVNDKAPVCEHEAP